MPEPFASYGTQITFIVISTIIVLTPILRYIYSGWTVKRDDILNSIDDDAKRIYLDKFERKTITAGDAKTEFNKLYHSRFGRRHFIIPVSLLFVLVVLESSLCVESIAGPYLWTKSLELSLTGLAAIAGAYMWVVSDSIWRARRLDLAPADVLWGVLRLFIAAPLGLSIGGILNESRSQKL